MNSTTQNFLLIFVSFIAIVGISFFILDINKNFSEFLKIKNCQIENIGNKEAYFSCLVEKLGEKRAKEIISAENLLEKEEEKQLSSTFTASSINYFYENITLREINSSDINESLCYISLQILEKKKKFKEGDFVTNIRENASFFYGPSYSSNRIPIPRNSSAYAWILGGEIVNGNSVFWPVGELITFSNGTQLLFEENLYIPEEYFERIPKTIYMKKVIFYPKMYIKEIVFPKFNFFDNVFHGDVVKFKNAPNDTYFNYLVINETRKLIGKIYSKPYLDDENRTLYYVIFSNVNLSAWIEEDYLFKEENLNFSILNFSSVYGDYKKNFLDYYENTEATGVADYYLEVRDKRNNNLIKRHPLVSSRFTNYDFFDNYTSFLEEKKEGIIETYVRSYKDVNLFVNYGNNRFFLFTPSESLCKRTCAVENEIIDYSRGEECCDGYFPILFQYKTKNISFEVGEDIKIASGPDGNICVAFRYLADIPKGTEDSIEINEENVYPLAQIIEGPFRKNNRNYWKVSLFNKNGADLGDFFVDENCLEPKINFDFESLYFCKKWKK